MAILAGQRVTAGQLNRIQPKSYGAVGSGSIAASQTNADVTDATVTFEAETLATYTAWCVWDYNVTGATAATGTARLAIDGVNQSPLATFNGTANNQRGTITQEYHGVLAATGSHTFKLVASTSTNMAVIGTNSSIVVEIKEVV